MMASVNKVHPEHLQDLAKDITSLEKNQIEKMPNSGELVTLSSDNGLACSNLIENGNDVPGSSSDDGEKDVVPSIKMVDNFCSDSLRATLAEADWRVPSGHHEDSFIKFLRHFYFPLYVKYHVHIVCAWVAIFIICVIYGPAFLSSTRSNLDLPAGTPSAAAVKAFQDNYPSASRCFLQLQSDSDC